MNKPILNIPHSSTNFPSKDGYIVNDEILDAEILKLTDWYTDDLFDCQNAIKVVADFSRIFCDIERFADDQQEIMAQYGMGALYEKTDEGKLMRKLTPELKDKIMNEYYWRHHQKLNEAVNLQLKNYGKALIVDCHSFSDIPFVRDLNQNSHRPDICIGTDDFHTTEKLKAFTQKYFIKNGYTVSFNEPYSGTIVPIEHYQKNQKVQSIMIEINRKLYLKAGTNQKSEDYDKTKIAIHNFLNEIAEFQNQ